MKGLYVVHWHLVPRQCHQGAGWSHVVSLMTGLKSSTVKKHELRSTHNKYNTQRGSKLQELSDSIQHKKNPIMLLTVVLLWSRYANVLVINNTFSQPIHNEKIEVVVLKALERRTGQIYHQNISFLWKELQSATNT